LGQYFVGTEPAHAQVTEAAFKVGVIVMLPAAAALAGGTVIVAVITPFALIAVTLAYLPVGIGGTVVTAPVQVPAF
jgi:hypothetical protein